MLKKNLCYIKNTFRYDKTLQYFKILHYWGRTLVFHKWKMFQYFNREIKKWNRLLIFINSQSNVLFF